MTFDSRHERLVSFAFSAMLTSAFFASAPNAVIAASAGPQSMAIMNALSAVRAAGWSGAQNVNMPSPAAVPTATENDAASTPPRSISDAQLKKILADNAANGDVVPVYPIVAKAFGIELGQKERHDSFQSPDKRYHTFTQFDNGNYLFSVADESISYDYYVDRNLVLIDAAYVTKNGSTPMGKTSSQTQAGLDAELTFFAGIANQL